MKVIDLLNKIANGEEVPKRIKYCNQVFELTENKVDWYCYDYSINFLGNEIGIFNLNDEVEIIESQEHKIPEKLKWVDYNIEFTHEDFNKEFRNICNAVDKIIDYLEETK